MAVSDWGLSRHEVLMRLYVIGAEGQVARSLREAASEHPGECGLRTRNSRHRG